MAETIRIEVVDAGGGALPPSGAGTTSGKGSAGAPYTTGGSDASTWNGMLSVLQRIEIALTRGARPGSGGGVGSRSRNRGVNPLGGNGWQSYLNRELPFGSVAINQMYARRESQTGVMSALMGLPDRMERALKNSQHASFGKDPVAFSNLLQIEKDYKREKFTGIIDEIGDKLVDLTRFAFQPYRGIAQETMNFGEALKKGSSYVGNFTMLLGPAGVAAGAAIKAFGSLIGSASEIVGLAHGKMTEESGRVRWASPELRIQGITAGLREMQTDMSMAQQYGAQMARQEDWASRREASYRLMTTKMANTITKPFNQMNEAWTVTLEALSGQRDVMDAVANAAAAIPMIGDWFKKDADRRNADFKEKQNMKDIENGKKLCEDLLDVILPGEIGLGELRGRPEKKKVIEEAIFIGGNELGVNLK